MKLQFFFIRLIIFVILIFSTATLFVMEAEFENEKNDQVVKYDPTDKEKKIYTAVRYGKIRVDCVLVNSICNLGRKLNDLHPKLFFNFLLYLKEILKGQLIQIEKYPPLAYDLNRNTLENSGLTLYGPSLPVVLVSIVHEYRDVTRFNKSKVVIGGAFDLRPFVLIEEKKKIDYSRFFVKPLWNFLEKKKRYVRIRYGNTKVEWASAKEISKRVRKLHRDRSDILYYLYLYSKRALLDELIQIEKFSFLKDAKRRKILKEFGLTVYGGLPLLVTISMVYGLERPRKIECEYEEITIGSPFVDIPFTNENNVKNYCLSKKKKNPSHTHNLIDLTKKRKKKKFEQALISEQTKTNEFSKTLIKRLCGFQKREKDQDQDQEKLNLFISLCQKFCDKHYPLLCNELSKLGLVKKDDDEKYSMITKVQTAMLIGSLLTRKNHHNTSNLGSSQDLFNETIQTCKNRAKNQNNLLSKKDKEKEKLRLSNTSER